jgi:hypothetical protein
LRPAEPKSLFSTFSKAESERRQFIVSYYVQILPTSAIFALIGKETIFLLKGEEGE